MRPLQSTSLKCFSYDERTQVLTIGFRSDGAVYEYKEVPATIVAEFAQAQLGPGRLVFYPQIKPCFHFRKQGELRWRAPSEAVPPGRRSRRP